MGFENVGRSWTPESFALYLGTINRPEWCKTITLHHTAAPSLKQRPNGLTMQHIENIKSFYKNDLGWKTGPHLFVDDHQIFGMCDLRHKGIHAASFNGSSIGIEVVGDYDKENPKTGRGLSCWENAAAVVRALLPWLGLEASEKTVLFHRDDPKTRKSCPGTKVKKDWVLAFLANPPAPIDPLDPIDTTDKQPDVGFAWTKWDFRGERWCVPVREFLLARGIAQADVIAKLKGKNGKFFYDGELLEGAYFVTKTATLTPNDCTWAPSRELLDLV